MDDHSSGFGRRDHMSALRAQAQRTREALDRLFERATPIRRDETHARHPFCDDSCGECMAQRA